MKKLLALFMLPLLVAGSLNPVFAPTASAVTAADWKAGRIIDDVKFTSLDMSVADIQNFLNAKVPVCDTWGTQPASEYGRSDITHAQYAASRGWPGPPYVCLKNYHEVPKTVPGPGVPANSYGNGGNPPPGSVSAAQMIYNAAQTHRISPKVLLVKLATESAGPLTTDKWPLQKQYTYAMGAYCPDSGPGGSANCNTNYAGFSIQISEAAELLRWYLDGMTQSWWQHKKPFQTNNILWNVAPSNCGGGNVYIETMGTAALYTYTPYQPNAAALANMYGTGNGCSAYGNRNFWRVYNDWFGATINNAYAWELIQESSNGKIYLVANGKRHWVPGPSLMSAWGLNGFSYRQVDSAYVSGLSAGANLSYVGLDINGNRYIMSAGKRYLLPSDNYVLLWGVAGMDHISAPGLVAQIPSGGNAGRFATDATSGITYLLDGTTKRAGSDSQSLAHWGQAAGNTTVVTSDVISRIATGQSVGRYVSSGGKRMIIDQGTALTFKNAAIESAWGSHAYTTINSYATNVISKRSASNFILSPTDGRWYYIEGGNKHYINSSSLAEMWGWNSSNALTSVSDTLAAQFITSSNLTHIAKSPTGSVYVVDGSKHLVATAYVPLWQGAQSPPTYSNEAFSLVPSGADIKTSIVGFAGHPKIYTIDNGQLRHIPNANVLDALGGYRNNPILTLNQALLGRITQGAAMSPFLKDAADPAIYYPENGYLYELQAANLSSWGATSQSTVTEAYLSTLSNTGKVAGNAVSIGNAKYLMNSQSFLDVTNDYDNYGLTGSDFVAISKRYFPTKQSSSYLVGTPTSGKIWLLSMGKRYHIPNPALLHDLGYGTRAGIVTLSPEIINEIPEHSNKATHVLRSPSTGSVFVSTGNAYGFKNSTTLSDYSAGQILTIPTYYFNRLPFVGWTSQLIAGTNGKIYAVSGGEKHWITGPSLMTKYYNGQTILWLPQSTIDAMPTGTAITS